MVKIPQRYIDDHEERLTKISNAGIEVVHEYRHRLAVHKAYKPATRTETKNLISAMECSSLICDMFAL